MLDKFNKYIPAISLLAIAALSVFNVGYFWRIGVHYLGIVDLSNIVYTFGLITIVLTLIAFFLPAIVRRFSEPRTAPEVRRFLRSTKIILFVAGAIAMGGVFAPKRYLPTHVAEDAVMLLGVFLGLLGLCSRSWLNIKVLGREAPSELTFVGLMIFIAIFLAGLFVADLQTTSIDTFKVETKSGTFETARIIRSSSSGFLLFVDGKGVFVPQSEIKSVKANFSPDDRR